MRPLSARRSTPYPNKSKSLHRQEKGEGRIAPILKRPGHSKMKVTNFGNSKIQLSSSLEEVKRERTYLERRATSVEDMRPLPATFGTHSVYLRWEIRRTNQGQYKSSSMTSAINGRRGTSTAPSILSLCKPDPWSSFHPSLIHQYQGKEGHDENVLKIFRLSGHFPFFIWIMSIVNG